MLQIDLCGLIFPQEDQNYEHVPGEKREASQGITQDSYFTSWGNHVSLSPG